MHYTMVKLWYQMVIQWFYTVLQGTFKNPIVVPCYMSKNHSSTMLSLKKQQQKHSSMILHIEKAQ